MLNKHLLTDHINYIHTTFTVTGFYLSTFAVGVPIETLLL